MNLKSLILSRLELSGATPKRSLGQNFLIDEQVVAKIIGAVKASPGELIIEVGPGLGSLTESLCKMDRPLVLIELDRQFADYWRERGQKMIEGDALQIEWDSLTLSPKTVLVSNLPYQISSSLVIDRCFGPSELKTMILMFQKEVAQRITASPRKKNYGMLSVMSQTFWDITSVCDAGPRCFFPSPKIASQVLKFTRKDTFSGSSDLANSQAFLNFVKMAFSYRRKVIWKNLNVEYQKYGMNVEEAILLGERLGLGRFARAEELSPLQFLNLHIEMGKMKCKK
ncbi:MAG: ribosomal RNA small subunit methyltransferase A [Bdellovibrionales bacterium]|nr:ribosomal RNA small subunit methyltransferase A [Bdellovibrionales bacterium]